MHEHRGNHMACESEMSAGSVVEPQIPIDVEQRDGCEGDFL